MDIVTFYPAPVHSVGVRPGWQHGSLGGILRVDGGGMDRSHRQCPPRFLLQA